MQREHPTHAAIRAQFDRPALDRFAIVLDDVADAVAELLPRVDLVGPSRLRVVESRPRGVVAILALPETRAEDFARHLSTALLTDNQVIVAPLTSMQNLIARRLAAAVPDAVRFAGAVRSAMPSTIDLVVTLRLRGYQLESGTIRDEVAGFPGAASLCEVYTRQRSHLVRGRSSLRGTRVSLRDQRPYSDAAPTPTMDSGREEKPPMTMAASELLSRAGIDGVVGEISAELCWKALESNTVGRLALMQEDEIRIFPVNYVVDGEKIYFRTAAGSKLLALKEHPQVALEIDAFDDDAAYSVVVTGTAARVESPSEIAAADDLELTSWLPTLKLRWVRIRPREVTGRVFHRGAEPDPYV